MKENKPYPQTYLYKTWAKIYSLSDEDGNVFYIGCTIQPIQMRIAAHISDAKGNHFRGDTKSAYIQKLNYKFDFKIIEMVWATGASQLDIRRKINKVEFEYILKYAELGHPLLNRHGIKKINSHMMAKEEIGQVYKVSDRIIKTA